MIGAFSILLVYQLVGEVTARALNLPLPGPVLGMLFLFTSLVLRRSAPENLSSASTGLLKHLALLFVPAGVGIINHLPLLRSEGWALLATLLLSTLVTLAVTAWTLNSLARGGLRGS